MSENNTFPPVFIINLEHSAERRIAMAAQLDSMHLNYTFSKAVDGHEIDLDNLPSYSKLRRRLFFGRDLTKGEMGCLLSHRAIYQHLVDANINSAIVLEDDAILEPNFPDVINALITTPIKWDVIRFLSREKVLQDSRQIGRLFGAYSLIRPTKAYGGAYAYLLTRHAARTFLKHMQSNWLPVDILHGHVWSTGLETFAVRPSAVYPNTVIESTIGESRFDKTVHLSGWQRAVYPLTRASFKVYEQLGKRTASLLAWTRDIRIKWQLRHKINSL